MGKRLDMLVQDVCGSDDHPLVPLLRAWAAESRAVLPFLEANLSKVRRKLRVTDAQALADVRAELAVAAWLLRERRWSLAYEPLAAAIGRGPDFRVAAPDGSGAFFVEVTRVRGAGRGLPLTLARTLADKVGQLAPGAVNVLAVVLPPGVEGPDVLAHAIRLLEHAAQAVGETPGGVDGRGFARGRARLGAVLLGALDDAGSFRATLHLFPSARHPLSPELARRLRALG